MSKSLLTKYKEELKKYNLDFRNVKEYNEKWKGDVYEEEKIVLPKHSVQKALQWRSVGSFAKLTKEMVDMRNKLKELGFYE
jgi:hypothetical protein